MLADLAFGASAILLVARLGLFGRLHTRFRGFDPARNTVSDYGVGPSRPAFTAMGVLTAAAYLLFAGGLLAGRIDLHASPWLLVGGVAAQLLMLFVPTDPTGSGERTATGITHWVLAIAQFALVFVFITNAQVPGAPWVDVLTWIVRVALYGFVVVLVVPPLRARMVGAWERAFLIAAPVWFLVVASVIVLR